LKAAGNGFEVRCTRKEIRNTAFTVGRLAPAVR
jgi:hypothetical protein